MQETGQYRAQTEQSMQRSAWMTYFSFLSPVMVCVGHLISQTPQPMHVSVMKWGIPRFLPGNPGLSRSPGLRKNITVGGAAEARRDRSELSGSVCVGTERREVYEGSPGDRPR